MRVIIEGFDGTGKSTLALAIQKAFDCRIDHHRGRPTDREHFLMRLQSCHYSRRVTEHVIFENTDQFRLVLRFE